MFILLAPVFGVRYISEENPPVLECIIVRRQAAKTACIELHISVSIYLSNLINEN